MEWNVEWNVERMYNVLISMLMKVGVNWGWRERARLEMVADDDRCARDNLAIYARLPVTTGCYALGLDGEFCVVS